MWPAIAVVAIVASFTITEVAKLLLERAKYNKKVTKRIINPPED